MKGSVTLSVSGDSECERKCEVECDRRCDVECERGF